MANERLKLSMSFTEMVLAMTEGNKGAMSVIMKLSAHSKEIDPDAFGGGLSNILLLDTLNIYGWRIWGLFKDVCKENLTLMIAVLRAYQMGQLAGVTKDALYHAIENRGEGIDPNAALAAVVEQLPNFNASGAPKADDNELEK